MLELERKNLRGNDLSGWQSFFFEFGRVLCVLLFAGWIILVSVTAVFSIIKLNEPDPPKTVTVYIQGTNAGQTFTLPVDQGVQSIMLPWTTFDEGRCVASPCISTAPNGRTVVK